jgi:uncharacterized protein YjbI with pentapeptide repeats
MLPQIPPTLYAVDDLQKALSRDELLSGFTASNQILTSIRARSLNISEAKLEKIAALEANLEKLGLSDVVLNHCDLTATNCADSSWHRVQLKNMRCSGLKLQTSLLKDVSFDSCKLDLSNFRFSKLKNVSFKNCVLDEADFYNASLDNVVFESCSLLKTEFSTTQCRAVDLRTSDVSNILGIGGLAGATIDSVQLVAISQTLAQAFKITVSDK